jgi:DNA invertase Pin-like site-specific DNA recombinase
MMKTALYSRTSTDEQNFEMQLLACRKYCAEKGHTIVAEYSDKRTGRNENRSGYQAMMKDALYRKFEAIIVWKMDRLTRGTIREVIAILEKLEKYHIQVISITEPYLSTDNPSSELILLVMAWCANMESKRIGERVSGGIQRWKSEHPNKRWRGKEWDIDKALQMRQQGHSWKQIETVIRNDGCDITSAGIRKELLKLGCPKAINLPSKKSIQKKASKIEGLNIEF